MINLAPREDGTAKGIVDRGGHAIIHGPRQAESGFKEEGLAVEDLRWNIDLPIGLSLERSLDVPALSWELLEVFSDLIVIQVTVSQLNRALFLSGSSP